MKCLLLLCCLVLPVLLQAQDVNILLKEADNLEKQLKEEQALDKYKQVSQIDASNIKALVKSAELSCRIGGSQADKNAKKGYYESAATYANQALATDSNNADANYAKALVASKMTEIEEENKKIGEDIRQINIYATKALSINPNHARANYLLGKWNYEMLNLGLFRKTAIKTFYGGLPKADIDTAIAYMEKCRSLDRYFVSNYLDLAKAYQFKKRPAQAIEVLTKLVRLPNRTADDVMLKAEGKKMLDEIQ